MTLRRLRRSPLPRRDAKVTAALVDCSDGELARLAQAGRQQAFAELLRRHRDPIYRIVRGHIGNEQDALELVQDSFVAAFAAIEKFDTKRPFRHWMHRIALNKCRDWGRRQKVRHFLRFVLPLETAVDVADEAVTGEAALDDVRALRRTMEALVRLPANLKEPLILTAINGLSQAEAAAILDLSEKAIETRVYRARKMLADQLSATKMPHAEHEGKAGTFRIYE